MLSLRGRKKDYISYFNFNHSFLIMQRDEWGEDDYNPNSDEQGECLESESESASASGESSNASDTLSSSSSDPSMSAPPPRARSTRTRKPVVRYQDADHHKLMTADVHPDELKAALEDSVSSDATRSTATSENTEAFVRHQDLAGFDNCPSEQLLAEVEAGPPDRDQCHSVSDYEQKLELYVHAAEDVMAWEQGQPSIFDERDTALSYYMFK